MHSSGQPRRAPPREDAPSILLEDEEILAVWKPRGWLVHRGWGRDRVTVADWARDRMGAPVYAVHRLDRGTSGVLLFAKTRRAASALSADFARREVTKDYLAVVRGLAPPGGVIDRPVPRTPRGKERVSAATGYKTLHLAPDAAPRALSLVQARPITGRPHQIRRHLRSLNHPIIGDSTYGRGALNRAVAEAYGWRGLALHAWILRVRHPSSGARLVLRAPPGPALVEFLERLGAPREVWECAAGRFGDSASRLRSGLRSRPCCHVLPSLRLP